MERLQEHLGQQLQSMVEAVDVIASFEGVVESSKLLGLLVVIGGIVCIEGQDLSMGRLSS